MTQTQRIGNIGTELALLIKQGADFAVEIDFINEDLTPFDLTPYTPVARLRKKPGETATAFTCTTPVPGRVSVAMSNSLTAGLPSGRFIEDAESSYVWDMEFVDGGGYVIPILFGNVAVWRDI